MEAGIKNLCPQCGTVNLAAIELKRKLRIAEAKNKGTLANNLCLDHRDKQAGKTCLACQIERFERENAELKAQRDTAYGYGNDKGAPPWMK